MLFRSIQAGTVHALGAGLVIAEIQQASDTTFRLFDWNRVDQHGRPRQLHIAQSLDVTDFARGPVAPQRPTALAGREQLVECDKFVLERRTFDTVQTVGGDDRCHFLVPLSGAITLSGDPCREPLNLGTTCLVPAAAGEVEIRPLDASVLLDIYLP